MFLRSCEFVRRDYSQLLVEWTAQTGTNIPMASYPAFLLRHCRKEIKDLVDQDIHAFISMENQQIYKAKNTSASAAVTYRLY